RARSRRGDARGDRALDHVRGRCGAEPARGRAAVEHRRPYPRGGRLIGGLVLAAGAATRFGAQKQLAELDGIPLLEHSLRTMTAAPVGRVVVVLGSGADEILDAVDLHGADPRLCSRWDEGQSASLACGLA